MGNAAGRVCTSFAAGPKTSQTSFTDSDLGGKCAAEAEKLDRDETNAASSAQANRDIDQWARDNAKQMEDFNRARDAAITQTQNTARLADLNYQAASAVAHAQTADINVFLQEMRAWTRA